MIFGSGRCWQQLLGFPAEFTWWKCDGNLVENESAGDFVYKKSGSQGIIFLLMTR